MDNELGAVARRLAERGISAGPGDVDGVIVRFGSIEIMVNHFSDGLRVYLCDLISGQRFRALEFTDEQWRELIAAIVSRLEVLPPLGEKVDAIRLAELMLDRPNADPDDDLALLSRQLLRALERLGEYKPPPDDDEGRVAKIDCVLDGYTRCAAKIDEACICAKLPAKEYDRRHAKKYGEN